jgi:mono/diheme cytochrome c family protein
MTRSVAFATALLFCLAPPFSTAAQQSEGDRLFRIECSGCHGPDGGASSPAAKRMKLRDLRSPEVQKLSDAELTKIISDGTKNMPGYKKRLGDAKVKTLVEHTRKLAAKK